MFDISSSKEFPKNDKTLNGLCERFVAMETEKWRRTTEKLGFDFNVAAFLKEAASDMSEIFRKALFYGADMRVEDVVGSGVEAARAESSIALKLDILTQDGLPLDVARHLPLVRAALRT